MSDDDKEILDLRRRVRDLVAERDALSLKVQWMEINVALKWESKYLVLLHENMQLRSSDKAPHRALRRDVSAAVSRCDRLRKRLVEIAGGEL